MFPRRASPRRARELSAFTARPAASQGGASALVQHVAGVSWEQQPSRNMFLIVQRNLGSQWSLLVAEQGKQRCLCTVAAAAVTWSVSCEKRSVLHKAEHDAFKYLSIPFVLVLLHLNLSRVSPPYFLANHGINVI